MGENDESATNSVLSEAIERIEAQAAIKDEASEIIKEAYAELKGGGFDVAVVRQIVRDRKAARSADAIAEERELYDVYVMAVGAGGRSA
jgi:uncharacterized protein (UPF0335 family)